MKVGNKTVFNFTMQENTQTLDEVVVVAFGTQKRANLTAAVATVDKKQLANRPVQNVTQALQGISPGLNVAAANMGGALNSTPTINIRGTGTIGQGSSSSPLILIDGIEGDMNLINPQDIENISILKDAGSSAIYGSRAAFGVVLITTKKGKSGKATINYNNNFRWSAPTNLPSFTDGYSFAKYFNEASANGGLGNVYSDTMLENTKLFMEGKLAHATEYDSNGVWKTNMESWGNTEWFDVYYKDWTFSQEHNLSLTGGTENTTYYISGSFLNMGSDQNYGNESYKRYTLNSNINIKAYSWLDINLNTKFSRKDYNAPYYQTNGVYYHSMPRRKPSVPIYTPDGILAKESQLNELVRGGDYTDDSDLLYQQMQFVIKPLPNLEIVAEGNFRLDRTDTHAEVLLLPERKEDGSYFFMARDDKYGGRSFVDENMYKTNYYNPNIYGKYNFSLNDRHNFIVTAGFQSELNRYKMIGVRRDNLISQDVPTLNNTTSSTDFAISNTQYDWATAGFFGRVNYDYKSRYLLEFNYRYDGASRFTGEKRWNSFPSISGAWNIARESFMDSYQNLLGNLKVRASYGSLGNQSASSASNVYPFYTNIPIGTADGSWLVGGVKPNTARPETVVNPLLGWEKVESIDVGLDIGMFNNRLNGSFDYFWRTTKGMIANGEELPNTLGYNYNSTSGTSSAAKINNANLITTGWDLSLSWRDALKNGLSYGATLVLSDAQTEVLEYPNPTKSITNTYYKGMKIGEIWGYETHGLAKTDEEMQRHLASLPNGGQSAIGNIGWTGGDVMYKDLNKDGKIDRGKDVLDDTGDRTIIGNNTPRYNFGVTLFAAYRNFDFSVFFQGTMKRDYWVDGLYFWGATGGYWQSTALKENMDYFRSADTDSYFGPNPGGYLPRPLYNSAQNQQASAQYLQNAAYMRLKNIQAGYTLPQELIKKANVTNLRVFVSADNLFTLSGMKAGAFDPEVLDGYTAGHGKASPLKTTISFGVSVTL
ncbi:MAG: TonB-dependent receptor [Tannerellaceae bacterium]|jgi:TonB-linked SusC/RagA family outer membrane protein|nr:TonB-dependent receptor [Tannerellaceae bacterium]